MNQSMFILTMFQHGFKVRWTTAYFVLIGKKTSSVLTYANSYQLWPYYHLFPQWSKEDFEKSIQRLVQQGFLLRSDKWVRITPIGKEQVQQMDLACLKVMDGWRYGQVADKLLSKFIFTNQVLSELSYHDKQYIPVEQSLMKQTMLKQQLKQIQQPFTQWLTHYVDELMQFLNTLPEQQATLLTNQLVGYRESGQTMEQIAESQQQSVIQVYLETISTMHQLLQSLEKGEYPYLRHFYEAPFQLNEMVVRTGKVMQTGILAVDELAKRVHKRPGTVMDYLIEMALTYPAEFPFSFYIAEWEEKLAAYQKEDGNFGSWVYSELTQLSSLEELPFQAFRFYQIKEGQKNDTD